MDLKSPDTFYPESCSFVRRPPYALLLRIMAKDPAFLFYYQDFAYGTRKMSFEEKGAYIELLCEQADTGHFSYEDVKRVLNSYISIWDTIRHKFDVDSGGFFYNKRLDEHTEKRKKYVKSRLSNLKIKTYKNSHMGSHMGKHMGSHMVNRNRNENKDINIDKDKEFIESLKKNKAYEYINIDLELGKMDAWLLAHKGRQKTKRFIVNWLNKIEKPLPITNKTHPQPGYKAPKEGRFKFTPPPGEAGRLIKDIAEKRSVRK